MLKTFSSLVVVFLLLLQCINSYAADKLNYDKFYNNDPDFKKMDVDLNSIYKKAVESLSGQDKQVFINEQRIWHKDLFPLLVEDKLPQQKPEAAAREVLKERINNLEKFVNSQQASGIMGIPVKFGMSKQEVSEKLGIGDKVNATPSNGITPFTIKLFGSDVPVFFKFSTTTFKCNEQTAENLFHGFATNALKMNPEQAKTNSYVLTDLWSVQTGDMDNRSDCVALLDDLKKKYKIVYPVYFPILAIINEKVVDYSDINEAAFKNQAFQDKSRYIFVDQSWGTETGEFNIDYISQKYLNRHIEDVASISFVLLETSRLKNSLGILPEFAGINDVVNTIGNREIGFSASYPEYYVLFTEIKGDEDKSVNVNLHVNKNNKVFAIEYQYIEDNMQPGFEENLIKRLDRRYKVLKETPRNVLEFASHGTNFDRDWETEDNYIHLGSTPHFAIQHELLIVNKKEIDAYNTAASKFDEQQSSAHEQEVREDLDKF